jgi:Domain of unknown function (DUF1707)
MSAPTSSGPWRPSQPSVPWHLFTQDPRTRAAAPLRASDRDRAVVTDVLAEAYADGRLTREEYDERAAAAIGAKTLGDLPPLLADLAPTEGAPASRDELLLRDPEALRSQAVSRFEHQRREALWGFLLPTLICWTIWIATSFGSGGFAPYFPWPIFVTLGTGGVAARMLFNKQGMIAEQQRQLERKLEKRVRRQRALEAGTSGSAATSTDQRADDPDDDLDGGPDDDPGDDWVADQGDDRPSGRSRAGRPHPPQHHRHDHRRR